MMRLLFPIAFSLLALTTASCSAPASGDKGGFVVPGDASQPFLMEEIARFEEPWAMAFDMGTGVLVITEKKGAIRFLAPDGKVGAVTGVPKVDYGGQGGLGDFVFAPGQTSGKLDGRLVYLSWVEAGRGDTRGAVVGRADLVCEDQSSCDLRDLRVIWRQQPKVTGRGHFSHRLAFSPDGKYLYISSGDRQKMAPAQDRNSDLGKIVRLPIDANGEPTGSAEQVSLGHRNMLGLQFDPQGRLWAIEHGPAGGDELNLIKPGGNYGWPIVSQGRHYNGTPIPDHSTRPDLAAPALSWNPVIAPGGMIFYTGDLFPEWKGQVLIAAMKPAGVVRVGIEGEAASEMARYPMENRIRSIAQAPDGAIWIVEDGKYLKSSRLFRLTPKRTD